jgi:hypothetical protein
MNIEAQHIQDSDLESLGKNLVNKKRLLISAIQPKKIPVKNSQTLPQSKFEATDTGLATDNRCTSTAKLNLDAVKLTDLFLEDPPLLTHVELVDDPNATIQITKCDLLTGFLCEV